MKSVTKFIKIMYSYFMLTFDYEINITTNQFKIIFFSLLFFLLLILFISFLFLMIGIFICFSYFVFKLLRSNIEDNNIFYYNYIKKSKNVLDLYGDYKINTIYLVRQNVGSVAKHILNFFTLYKYDKIINDTENSERERQENIIVVTGLYHTLIFKNYRLITYFFYSGITSFVGSLLIACIRKKIN